jgi:hypothetical protein
MDSTNVSTISLECCGTHPPGALYRRKRRIEKLYKKKIK